MQSFIDPAGYQLVIDDRRFLVQRNNMIAILYAFRGHGTKPYISTLTGPSGRNVLEDSPADHLHHHGVWWAHGDVNGVDFYLEVPAPGRRLGRIDHIDFVNVVDDGSTFGFVESLRWTDEADNTLINELRRLTANFVDASHYTVDLENAYTATRDITFGTTKESALPGIRIAEALTGVCGGHLRSSSGGRGERQIMGAPAQWIDCWGQRTAAYGSGDVTEGVACFDHTSNPNHPNRFFARAYGPISPFQGNHFYDRTTLSAGDSMCYRHRLVVHAGDTDEAAIEARYKRWIQEAE